MFGASATARVSAAAGAALVGFAANSILARAALGAGGIDASSFTAIRLASGAVVLVLLAALTARRSGGERLTLGQGSWPAAAALFVYAISFSFSYLRIGAAMGALILFAVVQATMIGWGIRSGERLRLPEWTGLALALGGLVALVFPGLSAPDPVGALLMATAGVAWGVYSLTGRGSRRPLFTTAGNFVRTLPLAGIAVLLGLSDGHVSAGGVALAVVSGAIASGVGYTFWYAALPALSSTRAAILQLLVPVLATGAAVALLGERLTLRMFVAMAVILGGVMLAILGKGAGRA